jgi:predicted RNase H-like nuclease (RuvC/YqgF family)
MESLSSNVTKIKSYFHSSRERLNILDASAKKTIGTEVTGIRTSLQDSSTKIQHTTSQMHSYLSQIEYTTKPETTVDMAPQISWLSTSLDSIVASLGGAQASADRALLCTTQYTYLVLDVGQEVEAESDRLNEFQSQAKGMASQAESLLSLSEEMLRQTQAKVRAKEEEIRIKRREVNEKRNRKKRLQREISQKNTQIAETERRRNSKKEDAGVGLVCSFASQAQPQQFVD